MPFVGSVSSGCCRQAGATLGRQVASTGGATPPLSCIGLPRVVAQIVQTAGPLAAYTLQVQLRGGGAVPDWQTVATVTPGALNTPFLLEAITAAWRWRVVVPGGATATVMMNSVANS